MNKIISLHEHFENSSGTTLQVHLAAKITNVELAVFNYCSSKVELHSILHAATILCFNRKQLREPPPFVVVRP